MGHGANMAIVPRCRICARLAGVTYVGGQWHRICKVPRGHAKVTRHGACMRDKMAQCLGDTPPRGRAILWGPARLLYPDLHVCLRRQSPVICSGETTRDGQSGALGDMTTLKTRLSHIRRPRRNSAGFLKGTSWTDVQTRLDKYRKKRRARAKLQ